MEVLLHISFKRTVKCAWFNVCTSVCACAYVCVYVYDYVLCIVNVPVNILCENKRESMDVPLQ